MLGRIGEMSTFVHCRCKINAVPLLKSISVCGNKKVKYLFLISNPTLVAPIEMKAIIDVQRY